MNPQSLDDSTLTPNYGQPSHDQTQRLLGAEIARQSHIETTLIGYKVPSPTGNGFYIVNFEGSPDCTCQDFKNHQQPCKHIYAVKFIVQREKQDDGSNAETQFCRVSYGQNWAAYNAAQVYEQELFATLLRDLCDTIPQPPQAKGRPRLPLSDMVFAVGTKVYSLMSARRAMTDIRNAKANDKLDDTPCFNSILGYLRKPEMTALLKGLIDLSAQPLKAVETEFAADSSGFSTSVYDRWFDEKWGKKKSAAKWIKAHIMCGVKTNIITAVEVTETAAHDSRFFEGMVDDTAKSFTVQEVSADKAYLSRKNLHAVEKVGGTAYIPFKTNSLPTPRNGTKPDSLWQKAYHYYQYRRADFLEHYGKRSNVETTFWMVKAKFGASVRSKDTAAQINEVLVKILCHNIVVLIASMFELGVMPVFEAAGLFVQND